MMPIDLKLDSNKVFHKVFEGTKPGYNATQLVIMKQLKLMFKKQTNLLIISIKLTKC